MSQTHTGAPALVRRLTTRTRCGAPRALNNAAVASAAPGSKVGAERGLQQATGARSGANWSGEVMDPPTSINVDVKIHGDASLRLLVPSSEPIDCPLPGPVAHLVE